MIKKQGYLTVIIWYFVYSWEGMKGPEKAFFLFRNQ